MNKKTRLNKITERIIRFRDERDWKQFHNPKDLAISISVESAELLELFLWKNKKEVKEYIKKDKQKIADEVADILHNVLLFSAALDIDLDKASIKKITQNEKKYPIEKSKGKNSKYTEY